MRWIDYGLGGLTRRGARRVAPDERRSRRASTASSRARGELSGYEATERFYEIGTPAALAETDAFLAAERV